MKQLKTEGSKKTITSVEISKITGKPHADLLKAIRKMEETWVKVGEGNFSLANYNDAQGKKRPMYELTKTESLYIATKFNDEARAKLVLRWEELETEKQGTAKIDITNPDFILQLAQNYKEATVRAEKAEQTLELQEAVLKESAPKVEYFDKVISSKSTYTTNQVAKELGMSARKLNVILKENRVQYKQNGTWLLYHNYQNKGYTKTNTYQFT